MVSKLQISVCICICISIILGCTNSTNKSKIKDSDSLTTTSNSDTNSNLTTKQIVSDQDKSAEQFDSLLYYFKNYRTGNDPAYSKDLSEYLLEDGIKMMYSSHTDDKHFFKFEDMEMIWITSNNIHDKYSLIIRDKSGHTNEFPYCEINCNDLLNIYYALNAYMTSKIPNCKTFFNIENSYRKELAEDKESELNFKKRLENAKTHNEKHIPQNLFESNCEFCKKEKSSCFSSPSAFITLQRYFKTWISIQNKNYSVYDNSKELSELKIFGMPWIQISSVSHRADGNPVSYRDSKSTSIKYIQKYIFTIKNMQGLTKDYSVYLFNESDHASIITNQVKEYLKNFKKRNPVILNS